ncbi:MAG: ATP-binding protein [Chitinophagaceae bacterium]|nr:ATP-binding protein [Chitinophagaceae bacterium]
MKRIFLFTIFFSFKICFTQSNNKAIVEGLTSYFKDLSKHTLGFRYNDRFYTGDSLGVVVDGFLATLYAHQFPNWKVNYFHPYYEKNIEFKAIIDTIDRLPKVKHPSLKQSVDNLQMKIVNLKGIPERICCYFFLMERAAALKDSIFKRDLALFTDFDPFSLSKIGSKLPIEKLIESALVAGSFAGKFDNLPVSLNISMLALYHYDSTGNYFKAGQIEENIARLYLKREVFSYKRRSIDHFQKAAHYYNLAGSAYDSILCHLKAAKLLLTNVKEPTSASVSYWRSKIGSKRYSDALDAAWEDNIGYSRAYALTVARDALIYSSKRDSLKKYYCSWSELDYEIFSMLGSYFLGEEDYETAKFFLRLAILVNFCDLEKYDLSQTLLAVKNLSKAFATEKKFKEAMIYINSAIEIAFKAEYKETIPFLIIDKANNLIDLNELGAANSYIRQALAIADSFSLLTRPDLEEYGNYSLFRLFQKLETSTSVFADSTRFYYDRYNSSLSFLTREFDLMTNEETQYIESTFEKSISHLFDTLSRVTRRLLSTKEEYNNSQFELALVRDSIQDLKVTLSSLGDSVSRSKRELEELELHRKEAVEKAKKINLLLNRVMVIAPIIVFTILVMWIVVKFRNRRVREKLRNTVIRMDAEARNLAHNIKDDYTDFLEIVKSGNFTIANEFASKAAFYLGLVTNKSDDNYADWTVEDELRLMQSYCDVRRIVRPGINIVEDFDNSVKIARIPSDIFTELLRNSLNSIKTLPERILIFKIEIRRLNEVLRFRISDNGIPSPIEAYIRNDRPNKGLSFLKSRIEAHAKLNKFPKKEKTPFKVSAIQDMGTTIEFIFPYDTCIQNTYS